MFLSANASILNVLIADQNPAFAASIEQLVSSSAGDIDVKVSVSCQPDQIKHHLQTKAWNVIFLDADNPASIIKAAVLQNQLTPHFVSPILIFLFHQEKHDIRDQLPEGTVSYAFSRRNLNQDLIELIIRTAKENLRQSILLDTTIAATNQHAIVAVTDPNGTLTYVNDQFCSVCEYARDELIGQNHRILSSGYHSSEFFADMWATITSGSVWQGEIKNKTRTGNMIWLQTTIIPFMNESGAITRYVTVRTDITGLKTRQEEALNKAVHTNNFLANISHEIRTPVHAILGIASLLQEPQNEKPPTSYLQSLNESAESLLTLVNDLLDYSKVDAHQVKLELVPFNVVEFADRIRLMFDHLASAKGLALTFSVQRDFPILIGDPTRIKQILVNLIGNALKFTDNGTVQVNLGYKTNTNQTEFLISVQDRGIGMRAETIAGLFQPFVQGDESIHRKFGGTGLGLSISKKLVDLMSGSISVTSEFGHGSTFLIRLPLSISNEKIVSLQLKAQAPFSADRLAGAGDFIVIDDDHLCRIVTAAILKKIGFNVVSFPNGTSALNYMKTATIQAVIVDNNLPDMSGKDVAKSIRLMGGDYSQIPVIAVTGDAVGNYDFRADGFTDWLVKPVKEAQILDSFHLH